MKRPQFDLIASGQRMRQIRVSKHITAKEVMDYMGFESVQSIYKWEAGKCYPQADNLIALARLYRVSPTALMVEENTMCSLSLCLFLRLNHWFNDILSTRSYTIFTKQTY